MYPRRNPRPVRAGAGDSFARADVDSRLRFIQHDYLGLRFWLGFGLGLCLSDNGPRPRLRRWFSQPVGFSHTGATAAGFATGWLGGAGFTLGAVFGLATPTCVVLSTTSAGNAFAALTAATSFGGVEPACAIWLVPMHPVRLLQMSHYLPPLERRQVHPLEYPIPPQQLWLGLAVYQRD